MNYLDLGLLLVVAAVAYRGAIRGGYRSFISLLRNILAIALAAFCQSSLLPLLKLTPAGDYLGRAFEVGMAVPVGPGFSLDQALQWLREAKLPQVLSEAIRNAWLRESLSDVAVFGQAASNILAKALLNLMCFLALFMVMRWLINIISSALVRALPVETNHSTRALGISLGIIESIIISAVIVAVIAPFVVTTMVPEQLIEHYRASKLVGLSLTILKWLGNIFYGV